MKKSAGILFFRKKNGELEVLLVHPGGPYWKNKDNGVWSVPKGEFKKEDPLSAAIREVKEEIGIDISLIEKENFIELGKIQQKNNKVVYGWGLEYDFEPNKNHIATLVQIEWPPKSGKTIRIPEIDRVEWFNKETALKKIIAEQYPFVKQLYN